MSFWQSVDADTGCGASVTVYRQLEQSGSSRIHDLTMTADNAEP